MQQSNKKVDILSNDTIRLRKTQVKPVIIRCQALGQDSNQCKNHTTC